MSGQVTVVPFLFGFAWATVGTIAAPPQLADRARAMMLGRVLLSILVVTSRRGLDVRPSSARQAQPDRHSRGGVSLPSPGAASVADRLTAAPRYGHQSARPRNVPWPCASAERGE